MFNLLYSYLSYVSLLRSNTVTEDFTTLLVLARYLNSSRNHPTVLILEIKSRNWGKNEIILRVTFTRMFLAKLLIKKLLNEKS